MIVAATGSYESAYLTAAVLLVMGAGMTVVLDKPVSVEVPATQPTPSLRPGALTSMVRAGLPGHRPPQPGQQDHLSPDAQIST